MKDCNRCSGRGWVYKDQGIVQELFSAFIYGGDTKDCPACDGKGEVKDD